MFQMEFNYKLGSIAVTVMLKVPFIFGPGKAVNLITPSVASIVSLK